MNRLLRQCREIGIGIIVVDQHPHLISPAALGNTYTSICMNLKDPTDINKAAALSRVPENEKGLFSTLATGQGVVKLQDRWKLPILVRFPHIDVAKGAITDDVLKQYIDGTLKQGELRRVARGEDSDGKIGTGQRLLMLDEFRLLHDVITHQASSVRERLHRLSWSGRRMQAIKEPLLARGWLCDETVPDGKTKRTLLHVPVGAMRFLGDELRYVHSSLVEHEYWQRYYAAVFAELGYEVAFEAGRRGGRVDVVATKEMSRIGIEIETGKSDIKGNVVNCLASGFDEILVAATNEEAAKKVEEVLGSAGLMLPERIALAVQDRLVWGNFNDIRECQWIRS